ncbi:hypothetical protein CPC08DRAFT_761522 [Agrocybe pediades]|nr:hypothetical protein CPC08DRAFT_761522 [Agrocybe pediades]
MARKSATATDSKPPKKASNAKKKAQGKAEEEATEIAVKKEEENSEAVCWTNELSQSLLTAISEDQDIKQGLFPAPGGNVSTARGGGKKKTVWQWKVAVDIFQNHPQYGPAFQKVLDMTPGPPATRAKTVWGDKIKNRIKKMEKIVRDYMAMLGSTGEGIQCEADIDTSQNNQFVNKWQEVKADCLWFFDMRALIAERPNVVHTGIGNSESVIDMSVFENVELSAVEDHDDGHGYTATSEGDFNHTENASSEPDHYMELNSEPSKTAKIEESESIIPAKRKTAEPSDSESTGTGKTPARAGTSKPAVIKPNAAKKSKLADFAAAAQAEEITRQKELELRKVKVEAATKIELERIAARREDKREKREMKLAKLRLKLEMAAMAKQTLGKREGVKTGGELKDPAEPGEVLEI